MHILVTRPLPDAWQTKAEIEKRGHKASLAPLIEIEFADIAPEIFDGASAIVVTSQNALRSLAFGGLQDKVRHLQVYAVGEATAKLAEDLKLLNISAGRGTASDLAPFIADRQAKRPGKVLHLTGDHKAYDLSADLGNRGIAVTDVEAYRQIAAQSLPPPVSALLRTGKIGAVTLFSPRTAEIWRALTAAPGLLEKRKNLVHICLSDAVAAKLQTGDADEIRVAAEPTAKEMLVLIEGLAARSDQE